MTYRDEIDRPLTSLEADTNLRTVVGRIDQIEDAVATQPGGVGEAPNDGQQYVRKSQKWSVIVVAPSTAHAPSDDRTYASKNGSWVAFSVGIADAPQDGTHQARKDGAWVTFTPGVPEAPKDGTAYARKDGEWIALTGTGGGGAGSLRHRGDWTSQMSIARYDVVDFNGMSWVARGNSGTFGGQPSFQNENAWRPLGFPTSNTTEDVTGKVLHRFSTPDRTTVEVLASILDEYEMRIKALEANFARV